MVIGNHNLDKKVPFVNLSRGFFFDGFRNYGGFYSAQSGVVNDYGATPIMPIEWKLKYTFCYSSTCRG